MSKCARNNTLLNFLPIPVAIYSDDMVWIPCSGTVLRGQEVLLGHEQLDDNMRVPGHPV